VKATEFSVLEWGSSVTSVVEGDMVNDSGVVFGVCISASRVLTELNVSSTISHAFSVLFSSFVKYSTRVKRDLECITRVFDVVFVAKTR